MLVDTDVFIWYIRGNSRAVAALDDLPDIRLSVVTYIELVQGMRNKRELRALRATLTGLAAQILQIDEVISGKAMFYVEQHFHSHAMRLADALIAATAVSQGAALLTANTKHYSPISDLEIRRFRPE
jgi:predicted nucleic acid-binding protein